MPIAFSQVGKNLKDNSFSTKWVSKERRKTQISAPAEGKTSRTYQLSMLGGGQLAGQHRLCSRRATAHAVSCSLRILSLLRERRPMIIVLVLCSARRLWSQICRKTDFIGICFMSELFCFLSSPAPFLVGKSRYVSGWKCFPFPLCCGVTAAFPWFFSVWIHFIVSHQISLLLNSRCHSHCNWEIVLGSA